VAVVVIMALAALEAMVATEILFGCKHLIGQRQVQAAALVAQVLATLRVPLAFMGVAPQEV